MRITEPGIYPEFSVTDYHSDPTPTPSLSCSIAKTLLETSLWHAWHQHPRLNPNFDREEATKFDIGNVAHAIFLGRGRTLSVLPFDDWRTKAAKEEREQAIAKGLQPVLEEQHERALKMASAAIEQLNDVPDEDGVPMIADFQHGTAEVMLAWRDGDTWFRTLIDWWPQNQRVVWDLKTTRMSVAPHELDRKMFVDGWHIQAAFHELGLDALDPKFAGRRKHRFIAQECEEPFAITVAEIPEDAMTIGRKQVANARRQWDEAMRKNAWPGYPRQICYPRIPEWAENKWLAREIAEYEDRKRSLNEPMLNSVAGG